MKNSKKVFTYAKYVIIALLIIVCGVKAISSRGRYPDRLYGKPVVSTEYQNIDISIEQIAEDDYCLYVMYHHSSGIIQVYDLDGNYQCTWFFYCHGNGGFSMTQENNTLYVQDMRRNVYVFNNGAFQQFLTSEEANAILKDVDFSAPPASDHYQLRNGSVWRTSNGAEKCVVEATTTQRHPIASVLFFTTFALCLFFLKYKRII